MVLILLFTKKKKTRWGREMDLIQQTEIYREEPMHAGKKRSITGKSWIFHPRNIRDTCDVINSCKLISVPILPARLTIALGNISSEISAFSIAMFWHNLTNKAATTIH